MGIAGKGAEKLNGSAFWILVSLLAVSGIVYLAFWGYFNGSIKAGLVFAMFSMLFVLAIVFSRFELFRVNDSFRQSSMAWFTGFVLWYIIGSIGNIAGQKSLLSTVTPNKLQLLSTLSANLPLFWAWFINNIVAPVVEESFWTVGLPVGLFLAMDLIGQEYSFMKNPLVQFPIVIGISAISFAFFHVGKPVAIFIIAAIVFRTVLTGLYWADERYKYIPGVTIIPAFVLGSHMGNNWAMRGIDYAATVMGKSSWGIITGIILLGFTIVAIDGYLSIPQLGLGFDNYAENQRKS